MQSPKAVSSGTWGSGIRNWESGIRNRENRVGRRNWLKVEANLPNADVGAGLALPHRRLHAIAEGGEQWHLGIGNSELGIGNQESREPSGATELVKSRGKSSQCRRRGWACPAPPPIACNRQRR